MSEKTLRELIDAMLDEETSDERREAAAVEVGRRGADALPPLRELLQSQYAERRWWAARALAALGGPDGIALLIETLADPDPDVRACAALGLGVLQAAPAVPSLVRTLGDDSAYVARIAGNALIRIGHAAAPDLIEALHHPAPAVRAGAARALLPLESEDAIPSLFAALDDDSPLVTYYAEEALWRLGVGMVLIKP